jgi:hypothetical protein
MKKSVLILSALIGYFLFSSTSCGDDGNFVNIKPIESQVYNLIKSYREANGQTGPFVQNYPMTEEAQLFSIKLAYGTTGADTTGIAAHWAIIHDKFGGTNDLTLIQITSDASAADIAANWTEDTTYNKLLLDDFTQCGVGIEYKDNQQACVTLLMMYAESSSN